MTDLKSERVPLETADMKSLPQRPVVLFDGNCNFCRACVHWLVEHDPAGNLQFAAMESPVGRQILESVGLDPDAIESVVYVDQTGLYKKSSAVLKAVSNTEGPWRRTLGFRRVPRFIRDFFYEGISNNRPVISRLVGTIDHRYEPEGKERERFLAT